MPVLQIDNPLIENYLAQFDRLSPEEQRIVFSKLRQKQIVVKKPKDGEQTEEQRKAAGRKFFNTWNGLLKGMPDMTMKEIRAERLERKYGQ